MSDGTLVREVNFYFFILLVCAQIIDVYIAFHPRESLGSRPAILPARHDTLQQKLGTYRHIAMCEERHEASQKCWRKFR